MRYEVFRDSFADNKEYMTQAHMEHIFREFTRPGDGDRTSLNEHLEAEFVSCDIEEGSLTLMYHIDPWMLNVMGSLHGGMIATICDLSMGLLTRYYKGYGTCVTVHLSVEYTRDVPAESDLLVKAVMEKGGKNVFFTSARAYRTTDNKLAAVTTAEFM